MRSLSGPRPRDSNQYPLPNTQFVRPVPRQPVRRNLFGPVNHQQIQVDLNRQFRQIEESDRIKYNFDFPNGKPINLPDSRYDWSYCGNDCGLIVIRINQSESGVKTIKQSTQTTTALVDDRKSAESERKRNAVVNDRQSSTKRLRLECTSPVEVEDTDTTDTATDDEDSV